MKRALVKCVGVFAVALTMGLTANSADAAAVVRARVVPAPAGATGVVAYGHRGPVVSGGVVAAPIPGPKPGAIVISGHRTKIPGPKGGYVR